MADGMGLEELLALIYAAPLDPGTWPPVAPAVARFLECESALIHVRGSNGVAVLSVTANADASAQADYVRYYAMTDPWAAGWRDQPDPLGVLPGRALIDPADLVKSAFYQDYARHLGTFHFLGGVAATGAASTVIVSVHRPIGTNDFDEAAAGRLTSILLHVERAVRLQSALAAAELQRHASVEALNRLDVGAMLVDADMKLAFANQAAETIIRAGEGITVEAGVLLAASQRPDFELRDAVRRAAGIAHGRADRAPLPIRLPRVAKPPLSAVVLPLRVKRTVLLLGRASAVVFVTDPLTRKAPPLATLAAVYGLTAAETRLLGALLDGERVGEYAERTAISINTARSHLKQLFAKTGTNRQAELMRMAASDMAAQLRR